MSQYQSIYYASLMSMASYANLYKGFTTISWNLDALELLGLGGAAMASEQAAEFSALFPEILAVNSGTGFSATVFQEAGADGPITVAIRGTSEALPDLVGADSELATCGAAYHQIVDMYNWWIKESSELNQSVNQYRIEQASSSSGPMPTGSVMELYREPGADGRATYLVLDQDAETGTGAFFGQTVNVTGHSLGGHLASAFTALFSGQVEHTYTYNAPGFTDTATNTTFFAELGGYTPFDSAVTSKVTRVLANNALPGETQADFIQDLHGGTPANATVTVAIEDLGDINTENHSIVTVTDSLAVFNLLAKMDSSLTMEQYNAVFHAASNTEKNVDTLETLIDTLQKLFGLGSATLLTNDREAFYQALYGVQDKITAGTDASGQFTISQTATIVDARTDFGVFLSVIPSASACSLAA